MPWMGGSSLGLLTRLQSGHRLGPQSLEGLTGDEGLLPKWLSHMASVLTLAVGGRPQSYSIWATPQAA